MLATQSMEISVNGERLHAPAGSNITSLLHFLNIQTDRVAVELNKSLVRKRDWSATQVPSGAQLEVVEFVGGG